MSYTTVLVRQTAVDHAPDFFEPYVRHTYADKLRGGGSVDGLRGWDEFM